MKIETRPATLTEMLSAGSVTWAGRVDCRTCEGAGAYVDVTVTGGGVMYSGDVPIGHVVGVEIVGAVHRCGCAQIIDRAPSDP